VGLTSLERFNIGGPGLTDDGLAYLTTETCISNVRASPLHLSAASAL